MAKNVLDKISIAEDRLFLLNMMGPRTASFRGTDKKFAAKSTKIEQQKAEQQRQLKEQKRVKSDNMPLLFAAFDLSSEESVDTEIVIALPHPRNQLVKFISVL